jgi:flavin-dependent dehydrogenase
MSHLRFCVRHGRTQCELPVSAFDTIHRGVRLQRRKKNPENTAEMRMKKYDVIIAGAGPAGLIVAEIAGGRGLQVLLVDIKKDIDRVFRSCCCNLIIEPGTHGEAVTYSDGAIHFENNKFFVPYAGSVIPLKNSFKVSPCGNTLKIRGKSPEGYVAVSYEKEVLLQGLLARVRRQKNIDIMTGVQALGAENRKGGVRISLRSTEHHFSAQGRVAVAADGVNSKIVESLGLNQTRRKFFARFKVASYHMAGVQCPYPEAWVTFVGKGHTLGGRGQFYFCPKPHAGQTDPPIYELTIGQPFIGKVPSVMPREELDNLTKKSRFAPWFEKMEIVDVRAATLNFYTPLVNPVEGSVVAVGDSAAFIETYVQGALMYGFKAANAIVKHLETGSGLEDYAAFWGASFEYNNPEEIKKATQGFGLHVLKDEDLDYLFGLTKGDVVSGFVNEFSDPDTVRNALYAHIEQVRAERPELAAMLQKMREVSVHDALQVKKH